jgi:acyl-ACP thioesterase
MIISEGLYKIHNYEADRDGKVFVATLMNFLQDMACEQAEDLGIGIKYLIENNLAWVIYKWDVKINSYPSIGDEIKVRTWPFSYKKFYAYRQFDVINSEGEVIATANSLWFLINLAKRRPTKISDEMISKFDLKDCEGKELVFEKLYKPEKDEIVKNFHVRYGDIDTNRHVNNVIYISWSLESIPFDILSNCSLKELKVNYEKETNYGDEVKVKTQIINNGNEYVVISSVLNEKDEKLTLVKSIWK